jgi:hypothetical protein
MVHGRLAIYTSMYGRVERWASQDSALVPQDYHHMMRRSRGKASELAVWSSNAVEDHGVSRIHRPSADHTFALTAGRRSEREGPGCNQHN